MTASTGGGIARGAVWMVIARVADRAIGVASTLILARALTPADFGLVAMAMSVIGLIELASLLGFEVPLLRAAQPTRVQYDSVWTLNLLFGLGCATAIVLAAWPAAGFYDDNRLIPVMLVLAAGWAVGSLVNIGIIDFQRNLEFDKEVRLLMTVRAFTFFVTVPSALVFHSYWALVAGMTTGRVARVVLSYLWHPYRPRLCLRASRDLFSFSLWVFVEKMASFGNARLGDFMLGRSHGAAEVGVYRLGEEIGYLPGSELVAPINRAFLPGAARLFESGRSMADVVASATGVVALLLIPACVGIAAVADPLVRAMLGEKWLAVIPIVEIMAINAIFVALWGNQQTALLAAGLPKLPGLIAIARFAVFLPCLIVLAAPQGAQGVALAALMSSVVALGLGLQFSMRRLSMSILRYIGALWRPLLASVAMYLVVWQLLSALDRSDSSLRALIHLLFAVGSGVIAYAASLGLLFLLAGRPEGPERLLLRRLRNWRS